MGKQKMSKKKKHKDNKEFRLFRRKFDYIMYFVGIIGPMSALPQVHDIWFNHNVANLSLLTWWLFLALGIMWLVYGVLHRYKPIILSNIIWIFAEVSILAGYFVFI